MPSFRSSGVVVPFLLFAANTSGQVVVGVEAGGNYSTLSEIISTGSAVYSPINDRFTASGFGYQFGLFLKTSRAAAIALEIAPHSSMRVVSMEDDQTVTFNGETTRSISTTTIRQHFVELPVLVSFQLSNDLSMLLGAGASLPISLERDVKGTVSTTQVGMSTATQQTRETHYASSMDMTPMSINGHIGLRYDLKNGMSFSARYSYDAFEVPADDLVSDRFGVLRVLVGYCLVGKRKE